jgi:hypothetical protein
MEMRSSAAIRLGRCCTCRSEQHHLARGGIIDFKIRGLQAQWQGGNLSKVAIFCMEAQVWLLSSLSAKGYKMMIFSAFLAIL